MMQVAAMNPCLYLVTLACGEQVVNPATAIRRCLVQVTHAERPLHPLLSAIDPRR
jgi:hypothetical protein